jgi:hypothetical protein
MRRRTQSPGSRSRSPTQHPALTSMYVPNRSIRNFNQNNTSINSHMPITSMYIRRQVVQEPQIEPKKQIIDFKEEVKHVDFLNNYKITKDKISEGQELFDAVICILCKYMSIDACSTACCDKVVCKNCINSWLELNNSCPECKAPNCKTSPQTKFMARVFNSFKLRCAFEDCNQNSLTYLNFTDHEKYCLSNPDRLITCEKCKLDYPKSSISIHDCASELVKIYNKLLEENKIIKASQEKERNDPISKHVRQSLK